MLEKNQTAPAFSSKNQDNQTVELSSFKGNKHVILYFYPKDDTPGCTIEANDFIRLASEFAALDTVVIGVSKDSCASHMDFGNIVCPERVDSQAIAGENIPREI